MRPPVPSVAVHLLLAADPAAVAQCCCLSVCLLPAVPAGVVSSCCLGCCLLLQSCCCWPSGCCCHAAQSPVLQDTGHRLPCCTTRELAVTRGWRSALRSPQHQQLPAECMHSVTQQLVDEVQTNACHHSERHDTSMDRFCMSDSCRRQWPALCCLTMPAIIMIAGTHLCVNGVQSKQQPSCQSLKLAPIGCWNQPQTMLLHPRHPAAQERS